MGVIRRRAKSKCFQRTEPAYFHLGKWWEGHCSYFVCLADFRLAGGLAMGAQSPESLALPSMASRLIVRFCVRNATLEIASEGRNQK